MSEVSGSRVSAMTELQKRTAQAIVNIFETGRVPGDYGKVTLLPGDTGHLTFGRSQTTLGSGNLHLLIKDYCERPEAIFRARLRRYLERLKSRDTTLDRNRSFRSLLEESGADPVMRDVQDQFFDRVYWNPSILHCADLGIGSALGAGVVYDSHVHGSWALLRARTEQRHGLPAGIGERRWIERYVAERRDWLVTHPNTILHRTAYRMDAFKSLMEEGRWALPLPLRVRGVMIDEESLLAAEPVRFSAADTTERDLLRRRPPLCGPDVVALQKALVSTGRTVATDGVFGARTEKAVRSFQQERGLKVDGIVGPRRDPPSISSAVSQKSVEVPRPSDDTPAEYQRISDSPH